MRSSREVSVTAVDDLSGLFPIAHAAAAEALAGAGFTFLSCRQWRTAADWAIPRRRLDDAFLFVPVDGRLVLTSDQGREALSPGHLAVIPPGCWHAMEYAAGVRSCTVLALHAHVRTAWGTSWLGRTDHLVARLPGHRQWIAALRRLAGVAQDHPGLGMALGTTLGRQLLFDVILAGHPLSPPASGLDPRLAAIVNAVQADPGAAPSIEALARSQGLGPLRLRQLFHAGLGCTPKAFVDRLRLARAADLLRGGRPVGEVARDCGFRSLRQLQVRFKAAYGSTPSDWGEQRVM